MLSILHSKQFSPHSLKLSNVASLVGLLMILYAMFKFDKFTPFPSLYALIPALGSASIVVFATPQTIIGKLLGYKFFVGVGLVSYSAYLWHQPLFAFARQISTTEELSSLTYISLITLTMSLAYLTWRFVEQPFRNKQKFNRQSIFTFAVVGTLLFGGVGLIGNHYDGFTSRFKGIPELTSIDDAYDYFDYKTVLRRDVCHSIPLIKLEKNGCIDIRKKNIVIWGDSYAAMLYSGLENVRTKKHPQYGITQLSDDNGPPFFTEGVTDDGKTLIQANTNRLSIVKKLKPDVVIIKWMIGGFNGIKDVDQTLVELSKTVDKILVASPNSKVVIIGPVPQWKGSLIKQMIEYYQKNGSYPPAYMHRGLIEKIKRGILFLRPN